MTDRIPEEIMREAEAIAKNVPARVTKDHRPFISNVIARALMARDQRAAEIAQRFIRWDDDDFLTPEDAVGRNVAARMIADQILSYDEAQQ